MWRPTRGAHHAEQTVLADAQSASVEERRGLADEHVVHVGLTARHLAVLVQVGHQVELLLLLIVCGGEYFLEGAVAFLNIEQTRVEQDVVLRVRGRKNLVVAELVEVRRELEEARRLQLKTLCEYLKQND